MKAVFVLEYSYHFHVFASTHTCTHSLTHTHLEEDNSRPITLACQIICCWERNKKGNINKYMKRNRERHEWHWRKSLINVSRHISWNYTFKNKLLCHLQSNWPHFPCLPSSHKRCCHCCFSDSCSHPNHVRLSILNIITEVLVFSLSLSFTSTEHILIVFLNFFNVMLLLRWKSLQ